MRPVSRGDLIVLDQVGCMTWCMHQVVALMSKMKYYGSEIRRQKKWLVSPDPEKRPQVLSMCLGA